MAALQYLESLRNDHPELSDWYTTLADLYQRKLWHQLSLKLEQFVALAVFQVFYRISPRFILILLFLGTSCDKLGVLRDLSFGVVVIDDKVRGVWFNKLKP